MEKRGLLQLRLTGLTYKAIGEKIGISRQRVQQLLSPPKPIRDFILKKYHGSCKECGLWVGHKGHVHHAQGNGENYNDIENLELLCMSCHRAKHKINRPPPPKKDIVIPQIQIKKPSKLEVEGKQYMTVPQAARELGKSKVTLYIWIKAGKLKAITFGGIMFIAQSEVEKLQSWRVNYDVPPTTFKKEKQ